MVCVERYRAAGRGGPDRIGSTKYHVIHNYYYAHTDARNILIYILYTFNTLGIFELIVYKSSHPHREYIV